MARVFEAMQKSGLKGTGNNDPASTFMQFYDYSNETDPGPPPAVRPLPQQETFNRHAPFTPGSDAEEGQVLDLDFNYGYATATAEPAVRVNDEDPLRFAWDEPKPQPGSSPGMRMNPACDTTWAEMDSPKAGVTTEWEAEPAVLSEPDVLSEIDTDWSPRNLDQGRPPGATAVLAQGHERL